MKQKAVVAIVFGGVLVVFLMLVYFQSQDAQTKWMVLGVLAALGAALVAGFIAGRLRVSGTLPEKLLGLNIEATSGMAVFVIVFLVFVLLAPSDPGPFTGQVLRSTDTGATEDDTAASGAEVIVVRNGAQFKATAGSNGYFTIDNAPAEVTDFTIWYLGVKYPQRAERRTDAIYVLEREADPEFLPLDVTWTESPANPGRYVGVATVPGYAASMQNTDLEVMVRGSNSSVLVDQATIEPRGSDGYFQDLANDQISYAAWTLKVASGRATEITISLSLRSASAAAVSSDGLISEYRFLESSSP